MNECADLVLEASRLRDENAELRAEIERLRRDCAELYQVVGVLANEAGLFEDQEVAKALDNANAAASGLPRPHENLLPFIPAAKENERPRALAESVDIVEELRADADAGIGWAASNLRRAADEIERLRRRRGL